MHRNMSSSAIFLLLIYAVIILIALGGNLLVCAAILYDRNLRRQQENTFLVSLAVSDLLVSILVMSFAAAKDTLGYWPFGRLYCQLWICCDITCTTASILNLSAIALHRFLHISRPLAYVRRRKIRIAIVVVWLVSASIGFTQIFFELAQRNVGNDKETEMNEYKNNESHPTCELRLGPPYALGSSMCSFFIPATVMVLLYTRLYLYAKKHAKIMRTQLQQAANFVILPVADEHLRKSPNAGFIMPNGILSLFRCCYRNGSIFLRRQHKATSSQACSITDQKARFTLGVIIGTFLICWLPFFIVNVVRSFFPGLISDLQFEAVTWLGYANSTANPIIYTIMNTDFRIAFKKILFDNLLCSSHYTLQEETWRCSQKRDTDDNRTYSMPCATNSHSHYGQQLTPILLNDLSSQGLDLIRCHSTPTMLVHTAFLV